MTTVEALPVVVDANLSRSSSFWKAAELSVPAATVPGVHEATRLAIQALQAEQDRFDKDDAAVAAALARRGAPCGSGRSVCYSIRLDEGEVAALETRATAAGLKPSVLARNLIRVGLGAGGDDELAHVVGRLETAVRELRSLLA